MAGLVWSRPRNRPLMYIANIISETVRSLSNETFIGDIGGDEFVVILPHHEYKEVCRNNLRNFTYDLHSFFRTEHIELGKCGLILEVER